MPIGPGDLAPDFAMPDQNGRTVRLSELRGKTVVLYFYPKDNTPGCTKEACSFRDSHAEFADAGAVIIGVSADGVTAHADFAREFKLPFTLIADPNRELERRFGVPRAMLGLLPGRVTYVIDPAGVVRNVINDSFRATRHVKESLGFVKTLRVAPVP